MKEVVMNEEEILDTCKRLGFALGSELKNEEKLPVFLCVMKGALNFMADLIKQVKTDILCDYIQISSYEGTSSTGKIILKRDIEQDIEGRTVVVVEDVIDLGTTMKYLVEHLKQKNPKRVIVCALFDKKVNRISDVKIDYVGKVLDENKFLVGYGLDYNGLLRNVPYVYIPDEEEIKRLDEKLAK